MANSCDGNASNQGGSPSESAKEKGGGNKRKFLSEGPLDVPREPSAFAVKLEEKLHNALGNLGSSTPKSDQSNEDEPRECVLADWSDPIACQLEELLTESLYATFATATKKLTECGYSEEVAEQAVLRSGLYYGDKDPVSNIVDGALLHLGKGNGVDTSSHHLFEDLQSLVEYTILEMVNVMREVKPSLSIAEAMWFLLISDLSLSTACAMEGDVLSGLLDKEVTVDSSSDSALPQKVEGQATEPAALNPKPLASRPSKSDPQKPPSDVPMEGEFSSFLNLKIPVSGGKSMTITGGIQTSNQTTVVEEKSGVVRKCGSGNPKREILRQKTLHMEKYRGRMSKGAFKTKLSSLGGLLLDKKQKPVPDASATYVKNVSSKDNVSATNANATPASFRPATDTTSATLSVKDLMSATDGKLPMSVPSEKKSSGNSQVSNPPSPKTPDYYAGIPYDGFEGKYVPQNEKDEMILKLVPQKEALEKELQKWTDWANAKVMQATRRLGKDKAELKALRQERDDAEKITKEKQIMEENTMKRLSEMESALSNASGQIDRANSAVKRLELENTSLKREMEVAKLKTSGSALDVQEALLREQETLKKVQSCDSEKGILMEELATLKAQAGGLRKDLEKAKDLHNQSKALWKQEEKEKQKVIAQASSIRKERERLDTLAQAEGDKIRQKAEFELEKYNNNIKELEAEISKLKLEAESSKIAALRRGVDWGYGSQATGSKSTPGVQGYPVPNVLKRLPVFQAISRAREGKQERECVMCMTEDISVIFLPCAHQVLCEDCNVLHEKQGMKDCPSCRTPIQKRFTARFAKK